MCLICWREGNHEYYPFVMVANRDEYYSRETTQAHWWTDNPNILAGRDLRKGGTWFGISKQGRFAALTNYRVATELIREDAKSRGEILTNFLMGDCSPEQYLDRISKEAHEYNDFNLIVADFGKSFSMHYYGSKSSTKTIPTGLTCGVGNAVLDTPWHKMNLAKKMLNETINKYDGNKDELVEALFQGEKFPHSLTFAGFSDPKRAPTDQMPETGVSKEWEEELSSIFVTTKAQNYGTRSQVVLIIDKDKKVTFVERSLQLSSLHFVSQVPSKELHTETGTWHQVKYQFQVQN